MFMKQPVSHFGYVVGSIEDAVQHWSTALGAGPFLFIDKMEFDSLLHYGESCELVHSAAIGQWGDVAIELMQIYSCEPVSLAQKYIPGFMPVLNHIAYLSPQPVEDSARLNALGMKIFLHAKMGEIDVRLHDARHTVGCAIEIHKKSDFIDSFFRKVKELSQDWDGKDPLRPFVPEELGPHA